jgi:hypothetical protein
MLIANPIYDIIFKYLMENNEIAKDILSAILNEEIVSLEVKPQETVAETIRNVRIYRFDFKATIRKKDGELNSILIEIQKSKKGFEIQRFRRYLGANYGLEELPMDSKKKISLPISTIYFLGYRLKNVKLPVLKVERVYLNGVSKRRIKNPIKENFVEQLSHDMYVIQIPRLKMVAQTQLEKVLDVFSQTKYRTNDKHVLEYTGDISDPSIERMVKYLSRAMSDEDIRRAMDAEDEVESVITQLEEEKETERKEKEEERKAKEEAIKREEQAIQREEDERRAKELAYSQIEVLKKQLEEVLKNKQNG